MMMTEAQMLAGLKAAAKGLGYLCFHNTYAIGSDRGFPDLVIVGHGATFFWELKGPRGHVRDEQLTWITVLNDVGQHVAIIEPAGYEWALEQLHEAYQRAMSA